MEETAEVREGREGWEEKQVEKKKEEEDTKVEKTVEVREGREGWEEQEEGKKEGRGVMPPSSFPYITD